MGLWGGLGEDRPWLEEAETEGNKRWQRKMETKKKKKKLKERREC